MVAAVRCPNPKCQKYMLVEPEDRGKTIPCLICKQPFKVLLPSQPIPKAVLLPSDNDDSDSMQDFDLE